MVCRQITVVIKKIIILLLIAPVLCSAQDRASFTISQSKNNSLSFEFTVLSPGQSVIYGMGISVFQNTGRKGSDYTGYIVDYTGAYEQIRAREGALYVMAGNSIGKRFEWLFRFGFGTEKIYINGRGMGSRTDELWYVRLKGSENILCGMGFRYKIKALALSVGWDTFNSFGAGLGVNL